MHKMHFVILYEKFGVQEFTQSQIKSKEKKKHPTNPMISIAFGSSFPLSWQQYFPVI